MRTTPNPFNPETWIPSDFATASDVTIAIYDSSGSVVRRLALGQRPAGLYRAPGRAAYWDGRNELGERVSSGVYVVEFRAGQTRSVRRIALLK